MLASSSQKDTQASKSLLLANFLELVINELREGHLQHSEEIHAENISYDKDHLDKAKKSLSAIY